MIAVVNLSPTLSQADALSMVKICAAQDREDVSPAWGMFALDGDIFARIEDTPPDSQLILLMPAETVKGAAGHHTEDPDGRITGVVAVDSLLNAGYSLFSGEASILCVLSHEWIETKLDPYVNLWADMPMGGQDAKEGCDRVQSLSYKKGGCSVSDFLLPQAFDWAPKKGSKFDYMGQLTSPYEVAPGGYAMRRDGNGKVTQVGERVAAKVHPLSRSTRRLAA